MFLFYGTQENFCIFALLFSYSLNYIVEINVLISLKVFLGRKSNGNEFSFFPTTWDSNQAIAKIGQGKKEDHVIFF